MVRDARQAQRLLAAAGLAAAVAVGACGGGAKPKSAAPASPAATTTAGGSGTPRLGDLQLVDCRDWRRGGRQARLGTIGDLRSFASGPSGRGVSGHGISTTQAYAVLDGWCKQSYATYFKLYKLYDRAAAFTRPPQQ